MDAYGQWSDWVSKTIVVKNNRPPVAVITMTPNSNITTSTTVTFSYTNSYDPDGMQLFRLNGKINKHLSEGNTYCKIKS